MHSFNDTEQPKILVTARSFIDIFGLHHQLLADSHYSVVSVRGPLSKSELLSIIREKGPFAGAIVGDDNFDREILSAAAPHLKVISKAGVNTEHIDLRAAQELKVKVVSTRRLNHAAVAEHTFGLILSLVRHIPEIHAASRLGEFLRVPGRELAGKTLGLIGLGRVGKEVAIRAMSFGMRVLTFNSSWSKDQQAFIMEAQKVFDHHFFSEFPPSISLEQTVEGVLSKSDIISIHINLTRANVKFLNQSKLQLLKKGAYMVNSSRWELIEHEALLELLNNHHIAGYAADVVNEHDPILPMLCRHPSVILTPRSGSRTLESVQRQGVAAVNSLLQELGATR